MSSLVSIVAVPNAPENLPVPCSIVKSKCERHKPSGSRGDDSTRPYRADQRSGQHASCGFERERRRPDMHAEEEMLDVAIADVEGHCYCAELWHVEAICQVFAGRTVGCRSRYALGINKRTVEPVGLQRGSVVLDELEGGGEPAAFNNLIDRTVGADHTRPTARAPLWIALRRVIPEPPLTSMFDPLVCANTRTRQIALMEDRMQRVAEWFVACGGPVAVSRMKRPGFAGGSDPTERWADASTEEVSA